MLACVSVVADTAEYICHAHVAHAKNCSGSIILIVQGLCWCQTAKQDWKGLSMEDPLVGEADILQQVQLLKSMRALDLAEEYLPRPQVGLHKI